ncbi:MAG TPA: hypothetical protein VLU47_11475, partial [Blastocatellia bacterium]|nr:hypothetical protein [Blastocatellia bacterium]
ALHSSGITLRTGEDMPPELIVDLLIAGGYVRQEPVGAVGEFSLRGGILDVFSRLTMRRTGSSSSATLWNRSASLTPRLSARLTG